MNWPEVVVLRGANIWAPRPMLEVELDLSESADASWTAEAIRRLRAAAAGLGEAVGDDSVSDLAAVFAGLTVALQRLAGSPVSAVAAVPVRPGVYRVAAEFEEEALGVASLEAARRLCLVALRDEEPDLSAVLTPLRELAYEIRLGPSTAAVVSAASQRGVPVIRLNDGNLVQLGYGARLRRIWTAETDRTGAIAEAVAQDKNLTRELLQGVGVPVPEGRAVDNAEDAWAAAEEIGVPVVVKPRHGNHGRGVATNLCTAEQVAQAFASAREHGEEILVERYIPGSDFRLLVVDERLVAAALREPPLVVGDGRSTVAELVAEINRDPRRSDGHATSLSHVKLDAIALAVLTEQGHAPESVPAVGERVLIRRNANLSSGGTATDVTDRVHPRTAAAAVAAARAVGLDIAGVDVVAAAIDCPLEQSGGAVVEVNAGPGLRMHLEPSAGTPRPVGEDIARMLFPRGAGGRIPLAAVTGPNGAKTARLLARILEQAGHLVGVACSEGLSVGRRQIDSRDCGGFAGARAVLMNPRVTAAVLEATPSSVLREGLGFDLCDVTLVTGGGHRPPEDMQRAVGVVVGVVSPGGAAVLDADDPVARQAAPSCPGSIVYYARGENDTIRGHFARQGRAVFLNEGRLVFAGGEESSLPASLSCPSLAGFRAEDALAAAAAAWALGTSPESIKECLGSLAAGEQGAGRPDPVRRNGAGAVIL